MLALLLAAGLTATVQFTPESALPRDLATDLAERAESFEDCSVRLGLGDPVAIDDAGRRLLLTGSLGAGAMGPFRSVALLSEDGGRTWRSGS